MIAYLGAVAGIVTSEMQGERLLEAGRLAAARDEFWSEAEAALAGGDDERLAAAALGLGGIWVHEHRSTLDRARVEDLQRRALAALDASSPLAPRLRARLAAEAAYLSGDVAPLLAELAQARADGDPVLLAEALSLTHHCLLGPHFADVRLALAEELVAISTTTNRAIHGLLGLMWRTVDLFLAGDRRAARSLRELRQRLVVDPCDCLSYVVACLDVMLAMRDGRLAEAERLAEHSYQLGLDVGDADAQGWHGAQLVAIRWLQGRSGEILPLVRDLVDSTTVAEPREGFLAAVAALAASAADHTTARVALAGLCARGLATVPSSSSWSATMLGVCEAAHVLNDAACAAEAYELLAPHAHLPVMASLAIACYGSMHRPLGLAAWTTGDHDLAVDHLERAAAADLAVGNQPCHLIDVATLADALEQRSAPGDEARARELRRTAIAGAHASEMAERAEQWARRASSAATVTTCRRNARTWLVESAGSTAVVPHSVGMEYLAQLIEHADVEIPAVELASGYGVTCRGAACEPVLDDEAKAQYRRHMRELREDLDDAEACADIERAARARVALDRVLEELERAAGFGGRTRTFADNAERARVSVRKALRRAVEMIKEADPMLGRAIDSRVVTGMRCVYVTHPPGVRDCQIRGVTGLA